MNGPLATLADILLRRARDEPQAIAYRFFQGEALQFDSISYAELAAQASALAAHLQRCWPVQSRLLLVCKSQQHFVVAFFATQLAGMIAVPTALPRRHALQSRMQLLAQDAQVAALLSDADELLACALEADGVAMPCFDLREAPPAGAPLQRPDPQAAPIAFLQYTSGSTGDPKGVVIGHANLMSNSRAIQDAMHITRASSVFTALPMFHDMGLVGGLLQPMYTGCTGNWMTPAECVQYPERWLQIMARYKVTISGGPNFMYSLAAKSVTADQMAGLDLSHWEVAFCGAEPVRAATVAKFTRRFAPYGLRAQAFYPCYGMAESTLFITGKQVADLPLVCGDTGNAVVSCGAPRQDTRVAIVEPQAALALADGEIGEIWVSGSSVALGYWGRPQLSAACFQARLADSGRGPFLRTGDLGYLKDGQLYVTGRLKDLIIVYGRKYAPQDLEAEAEASHAALREAGGAAFSVTRDGADCVVLVFELNREWLRRHAEWPAVESVVRRAVQAAHGLKLDAIVFIKPGALPRTSSGKVMRAQCRSDYLAGELARLAVPA